MPEHQHPLTDKLNEIIERLDRMEKRQLAIKAEVEEVQKEVPVVGSFGTVDVGNK